MRPRSPGTSRWRSYMNPGALQRWFHTDRRRLVIFPVLVVVILASVFISGDTGQVLMALGVGVLLLLLAVVFGPWSGRGRLIDTMPDQHHPDDPRR